MLEDIISTPLIYLFKHNLGDSRNNNFYCGRIHVPFLLNVEHPVASLDVQTSMVFHRKFVQECLLSN